MKTFRDYLTEAEIWSRSPRTGDGFAINIREETLIETVIHSTREDAVILAADEGMIRILESYHMLAESVSVEEVELRDGSVVDVRVEYDLDADSYDVESAVDMATGRDVSRSMTQRGYRRVLDAIGDHLAAEREQSRGDGSEMANLRDLERQLGEAQKSDQLYGLRIGDTVTTTHQGAQVQGNIIDIFPEDMQVELLLRGPEAGRTVTVDVRDTQILDEGAMSGIDIDLQQIARDPDLLYDAFTGKMGRDTERWLVDMFNDVSIDNGLHPDDQQEEILEIMMDHIMADYGDDLDEAKYQGREVPLGKPMQGDVAKFKVYVKDPKTGNVKKVNFGDKSMRIKKSNPKRRKSFRARHNCANPGPRTKARFWSCRKW